MNLIEFPKKDETEIDEGVTRAFASAIDHIKKGGVTNCAIILHCSNGKHYKSVANINDSVYFLLGLMESLKNEVLKNEVRADT